ncbi:MAG TPA: RDD family protein [Nocardioides sp.]|uniref:RDD family protein n=1 Tax=Nocardioides sp. TaxID=35761 RepID=UPI002D01D83D|nr:RDD family protein [Nocardioides sp.]HQR26978.1 RDD family protein [Nocardioides sp.]
MSYQTPPPAPPPGPTPPNPYAQPVYGAYASWVQRAIATVWDWVYLWPGLVVGLASWLLFLLGAGADGGGWLIALGIVLSVVATVLLIWRLVINYMLDQGRTGYTFGKRKVGIRTLREQDGQPSGVGSCVARYFLHSIINQACYIDYLWPLWDQPKRQTLTDKILSTIVINQPPA